MQPESKYGSILHILAVALVMSLPGLTLLSLLQCLDLQKGWSRKIPIVIELKVINNKDSVELLMKELQNSNLLEPNSVEFISRNQALETMRSESEIGLNDSLIDNPFSDIILVYPIHEDQSFTTADRLRKTLKNKDIIEQMDSSERIESSMNRTFVKINSILFTLTVFLFILASFIVNYLVKIFMQRKKDLIQTLYLMGGDPVTIYEPYRKIGIRQGLASSLLSIVLVGIGILIVFALVPGMYKLIGLKNFIIVMLVLVILGPTLHIIRLKKIIQSLL